MCICFFLFVNDGIKIKQSKKKQDKTRQDNNDDKEKKNLIDSNI